MSTTTTRRKGAKRMVLGLMLSLAVLPAGSLVLASPAGAAGDPCDLCSIDFNPGLCDEQGRAPYDSTIQNPDGSPIDPGTTEPPAPSEPAPVVDTGAGAGESTDTGSAETAPAAPVAGAPAAPAAPKLIVKGESLTITWVAPADGGSPITGYKVALNGGTAVPVAPSKTSYTFPALSPAAYTATVVAINAAGSSPVSASTKVTIVAAAADEVSQTTVAATDATDAGSTSLGGVLLLVGIVVAGAVAALIVLLRRRLRTPTTIEGQTP